MTNDGKKKLAQALASNMAGILLSKGYSPDVCNLLFCRMSDILEIECTSDQLIDEMTTNIWCKKD